MKIGGVSLGATIGAAGHKVIQDVYPHAASETQGFSTNVALAYDAAGKLRLAYRTPDWEDSVGLAITEIRHFGRDCIQIVHRMRALLESLIEAAPPLERRGNPLAPEEESQREHHDEYGARRDGADPPEGYEHGWGGM